MVKILLLILVVLVAVGGYAATRPDSFRLERRVVINAPAEKVFPLINDFQKWVLWSPWEKKDPSMKRSYSGPAQGLGAGYGWEGNKNVGSGRMEIIDSQPAAKVGLKLDFMTPFEAHNVAEFILMPVKGAAGQTEVSWAMSGPQPFVAKLMSLVFNMEKMVGPDFEQGLASMKAVAERP
jgi:Polyketide cyclase / dehydrase and lipid transport